MNKEKIFDDKGVTDHFAIIPTGESKSSKEMMQNFTIWFPGSLWRPFIPKPFTKMWKESPSSRAITSKANHRKSLKKQVGKQYLVKKSERKRSLSHHLSPGKNKVEGVPVENKDAKAEEFATKPPSRISEAGLLSLMENAGRQVDDAELASALNTAEGLRELLQPVRILSKT